MNLDAWQDYYGFDRGGGQARFTASFDPATLELALEVDGEIPHALPVEELHGEGKRSTPGPVEIQRGSQVLQFCAGVFKS